MVLAYPSDEVDKDRIALGYYICLSVEERMKAFEQVNRVLVANKNTYVDLP